MKTPILFFLFFFSVFCARAQSEENFKLQPCLKASIVFYLDNSSSLDKVRCNLAKQLSLVPTEEGYIEVSLISFDETYDIWCKPTANEDYLAKGIEDFCDFGLGAGTIPLYGLDYINTLFSERRIKQPNEWQILLIDSDYYWSAEILSREKIQELLDSGVVVLLSIPKSCDGVKIGNTYQTDEKNYELIKNLGCEGIRSDFGKFRYFLESLEPKVPCG